LDSHTPLRIKGGDVGNIIVRVVILLYYSLDTKYEKTQVNMNNYGNPIDLLEDESKGKDNVFIDVSYQ
jgi:hypothetical protein